MKGKIFFLIYAYYMPIMGQGGPKKYVFYLVVSKFDKMCHFAYLWMLSLMFGMGIDLDLGYARQ